MMRRLASLFGSAARDRRGIAAIEFALIAPILFALYFLTMEFSQAIETNKKVGRISSMVGDLVAQQSEVRRDDLDAILDIGSAIIQPYGRSTPKILVEHIRIEDTAEAKAYIVWSRQLDGTTKTSPIAPLVETTVPADMRERGKHLVRVTTELSYRPVIAWTEEQKTALGLAAAFDNIAMSELAFLRPRTGRVIACSEC